MLQPHSDCLRGLLSNRELRIRLAGAKICMQLRQIDPDVAQTLFQISDLGRSAPAYVDPSMVAAAAGAKTQGEAVLRAGVTRNLRRQLLAVLAALPGSSLECADLGLS